MRKLDRPDSDEDYILSCTKDIRQHFGSLISVETSGTETLPDCVRSFVRPAAGRQIGRAIEATGQLKRPEAADGWQQFDSNLRLP